MISNEGLVRQLYDGFNKLNVTAVLQLLADDVQWANGMEGGHVSGREAVRDYWTAQWAAIQPNVEPLQIEERGDGTVAVQVRQIVRDLEGGLMLDERVTHVFRFEDGLVSRFDIEGAGGLAALGRD